MDDLKNSRGDVLPKILDVPIQTNPFGRNRSGERAYRRAERLAAAIFLLTNHIPETESMRGEVRRLTTKILANILDSRDEMRVATSGAIADLQSNIRQVISLLRLMVFAGYISAQNADVVTYAADELGTFVAVAARSPLSETVLFSKDELIGVPDQFKIQHKGQKDIKDRMDIRDSQRTTSASLATGQQSAASVSPRGGGIVGILRRGGELNIRDIAAHLPEYGEKTIQRELNSLIREGLVKRTGLKRWSRYSLA